MNAFSRGCAAFGHHVAYCAVETANSARIGVVTSAVSSMEAHGVKSFELLPFTCVQQVPYLCYVHWTS